MNNNLIQASVNDMLESYEELVLFLQNPEKFLENKAIYVSPQIRNECEILRNELQHIIEKNYLMYFNSGDSKFREKILVQKVVKSFQKDHLSDNQNRELIVDSSACLDTITCFDKSGPCNDETNCIDNSCANLETICTNTSGCLDSECVNTGNASDVGCTDSQCTDSECLNGRNAATSGNSCTDTSNCLDSSNCTNDFGCEDDNCTDNQCNNLSCTNINTCTDTDCMNEGSCSDSGTCTDTQCSDVDSCTKIP